MLKLQSKLKWTSGVLVSLVVAVACGSPKKKDDDSPAPAPTAAPSTAPAPAPSAQSQFQQKLVGNWHNDCEKKWSFSTTQYYGIQQVYDFTSDGSLKLRTINFDDGECKTENLTVSMSGEYSIGEKSAKLADSTAMTVKYKKILITLKSPSFINNANSTKLCGISDWKADEEREVNYGMDNCSVIKDLESQKDSAMQGFVIINDNVLKIYSSEYDSSPDLYKK